MASSDVFHAWTKHSLFQQNRFVTEVSTVLMVLISFCVPTNQLHKHLLEIRGEDVSQVRYIAIVALNVWPWTRFCAIFQVNAKTNEGWKTNASHNVILDRRFVMMSLGR